MIYTFRYRRGEIEAEVVAENALEAHAKVQRGEAEYFVLSEALHSNVGNSRRTGGGLTCK